MNIKYWFALAAIATLGACGKSNNLDESKKVLTPTVVVAAEPATGSVLGDKMLGSLSLALAAELTPQQITTISNAAGVKAKAALSATGLHLTATTDADKVLVVAGPMVFGAIESLAAAGITLAGDAPKIKRVVKLIQNSVLKSIKTEHVSEALTADNKKSMFKNIFSSAVSSLNEGGFVGADAAAFVGELVQDGITNLDDAGIENTQLGEYVSEVLDGANAGLVGSSISAESLGAAMAEIASDAVSVMDDFGMSSAEAAVLVSDITSAMISSLQNAGIAAEGINAASAEIMAGIIGSLDEAGFNPASVTAMSNDLIQVAVDEVGNLDSIQGATDIADFTQSLTEGVIGGLNEAGVAKEDIDNAAASIAAAAVESLSNIEGMTAADISAITTSIEEGAATGLQDAGYSAEEAAAAQANIEQEVNQAEVQAQQEVNGVTWKLGDSCADIPADLDLSVYQNISYASEGGYFCAAPTEAFACSQISTGVSGGQLELATLEGQSYCIFKATITDGIWKAPCMVETDAQSVSTSTQESYVISGQNFTFYSKVYSDGECLDVSLLSEIKVSGTIAQPFVLGIGGNMSPINFTFSAATMKLATAEVVTAANTDAWFGVTQDNPWVLDTEKSIAGLSMASGEEAMPAVDSIALDVFYLPPGDVKSMFTGTQSDDPANVRSSGIDWNVQYVLQN